MNPKAPEIRHPHAARTRFTCRSTSHVSSNNRGKPSPLPWPRTPTPPKKSEHFQNLILVPHTAQRRPRLKTPRKAPLANKLPTTDAPSGSHASAMNAMIVAAEIAEIDMIGTTEETAKDAVGAMIGETGTTEASEAIAEIVSTDPNAPNEVPKIVPNCHLQRPKNSAPSTASSRSQEKGSGSSVTRAATSCSTRKTSMSPQTSCGSSA